MATFTSTSGSYTTTLTVTQTSQSTQNNQSTLTYSLTLTKNAGTGLWNNNSCPWSITIDGSTVASGSFTYDFRNYSSLTLKGSTTTTVTHNSDGTKTVACSASVNMDNEPYVYVMKPSGDLALTTIPRASDVSVSNYSITNTSGSISATITSKASFYHKWRWRMNSGSWSSWTNKGLIASTSSTVTVANTTLLAQLPSATSGSFNIEVATYSDSGYATLVGTKSASATVSVNTSNIKPSVSLGNIGLNSTPISGYAVAGYSKVQSAWTTTNSSGASSVTTYFTTSHGSLATTSSTSTSGTTVSGVIPSSSANYTLTISAYAKDSRGAVSSTVSKTITVYGYTPPTATLNAYRVASSSSTTEDGAGTYAYVTFSGAVSSSVNSQNAIQSTTCTYSGSISGTASSGGHYALADTQTVTFTLTVTDKVTSSTAQKTINTATYPLDLYDNGSGSVGVGLGAVAVGGRVTSALPISMQNLGWFEGAEMHTGSLTYEGNVYNGVHSIAGKLFFSSSNTASGNKAMNAMNNAGTYKEVIRVDQNNACTFYGNAVSANSATNATNATNATYAQYPILMNMSNTDLNTIKTQGVYYGYTGMTNAPQQSIATMEVIRYSGDWLIQRFTCPYGDGTSAKWERTYYGGSSWSSWYRIYKFIDSIYSGNFLGGTNITLAGAKSKYKRLKVYAVATGAVLTNWEIDVNNITTTTFQFNHSVPIYASDVGDWYLTIFHTKCTQSGNDVGIGIDIYNKRIGTSGQSTQNNNSNYRIYRIDGIV